MLTQAVMMSAAISEPIKRGRVRNVEKFFKDDFSYKNLLGLVQGKEVCLGIRNEW